MIMVNKKTEPIMADLLYVLLLVAGAVGVLLSAGSDIIASLIAQAPAGAVPDAMMAQVTFGTSALLAMVLAILYLAAGIGVRQRRRWAALLAVVVSLVSAAVSISAFLLGSVIFDIVVIALVALTWRRYR